MIICSIIIQALIFAVDGWQYGERGDRGRINAERQPITIEQLIL